MFSPFRRTATRIAVIALAGSFCVATLSAQAAPTPPPGNSLVSSDTTGLDVTFDFPNPTLSEISRQEGNFTRVIMPNDLSDGGRGEAVGTPEIPYFRRIVAVPAGTQRVSQSNTPTVRGTTQLNGFLYPLQNQAVDQSPEFGDPPFVFNIDAYRQGGLFPAQGDFVRIIPLGTIRDVQLYAIDATVGQYDASKGTLTLFSKMNVVLSFSGGSDSFGTDQTFNPFEDQVKSIYAGALNAAAVEQYVGKGFRQLACYGSEFLIITPPAFRAAANTLRDWKNTKGISTKVVETGSASGQAGTTKEQIQSYIRNQYNNCTVRLSYVLLLGDAEFIAPWYRNNAASDLDYALLNNADMLPDLAIGRMPVDTLAQAQMVVDKTVAYERNPPFNAAFYNNATIASYFQCCRPNVSNQGTDRRWFIETSELVRNQMLARGYNVQRIYDTSVYNDDGGTYTGDTTPRRYYDGTLLPSQLAPGTFSWNGTTNNIIDAFNAGRFLILHRGHGSKSGWGDPSLTTANLGSLTNGSLTPVVFSVNCASGYFDNETDGTGATGVYFMEQLLRQQNGMVAGLGDTRNSPTVQNNALTRGFFDAIWPNTLPGYGSNTSIRRMGDILNYSKAYMVNEFGINNDNVKFELAAWHVYGDPTLEIRISNPYKLVLPFSFVIKQKLASQLVVEYPLDGAVVTVLQDGDPIARGKVVNGQVVLPYINPPKQGVQLSFSASFADASGSAVSQPLVNAGQLYLPMMQ